MAKLETQINQIYLSPQESKKVSLILFEEKLNAQTHLFLIAELKNIQKKTELNDLSKISEMIIESFKANQKAGGEAMFETSLAEVNNKLAEFAHKGRKSWIGKFSALIAVQSDRDFYLANTGHTCAWLKRKNTLNEIISPDKTASTHPLKTFINFSSGRMIDGDNLVLATSSIFNYISVELFSRTLNSYSLTESCTRVSGILKDSAKSDEGFAVFMLELMKKAATIPSAPAVEPVASKPAPVAMKAAAKNSLKQKVNEPAPVSSPSGPIYAPLPEEMYETEVEPSSAPLLSKLPALPKFSFRLPSVNKINFPKWNFNFPGANFLPSVSGPAKFFLGSFILFAVLFAMNLTAYGVRKAQSKQIENFNASAETLVNYLEEAETSLLYKNQGQAMKLMSSAETELHKLNQIDEEKATPFRNKFEEMNNKVNRVTVLRDLTPAFETQFPLSFMARAGSGYLISNENPNSLGIFTDDNFRNLFMLNKVDGDIKGVAHVSGHGNFVASKDKVYRVNESNKEFEQYSYISNADLLGLKFVEPNRLYSINKTTDQVIRMNASTTSVSAPTNILRVNTSLQDAQDFAVDTDVYVLFPDRVVKFTNGSPVDFQLGPVSEPLKEMKKIRIGNQIYLLEPIAKRILIYTKRGELLNQVQLPNLTDLKDLYVDETKRELLLVNGNKVYRITF